MPPRASATVRDAPAHDRRQQEQLLPRPMSLPELLLGTTQEIRPHMSLLGGKSPSRRRRRRQPRQVHFAPSGDERAGSRPPPHPVALAPLPAAPHTQLPPVGRAAPAATRDARSTAARSKLQPGPVAAAPRSQKLAADGARPPSPGEQVEDTIAELCRMLRGLHDPARRAAVVAAGGTAAAAGERGAEDRAEVQMLRREVSWSRVLAPEFSQQLGA